MKKYTSFLLILLTIFGCAPKKKPSVHSEKGCTILTALPLTASLLKPLCTETDIDIITLGNNRTTRNELPGLLQQKGSFIDSIADNIDAVAGFRNTISEDALFPRVREKNIRVVELDPSLSLRKGTPRPARLSLPSGKTNPFIWLSATNTAYMIKSLARDLVALNPADSAQIGTNRDSLMKNLRTLQEIYG
ncbi:MAG: hypothetical protein ACQEQV_09025, partial [Fibrobacterota bacterium]